MSAIKIKERLNVVIDFTKKKINSNRVYKSLRAANVVNYIQLENKDDNFIIKKLVNDNILNYLVHYYDLDLTDNTVAQLVKDSPHFKRIQPKIT